MIELITVAGTTGKTDKTAAIFTLGFQFPPSDARLAHTFLHFYDVRKSRRDVSHSLMSEQAQKWWTNFDITLFFLIDVRSLSLLFKI